jgi:hypothetical protein
VRRFLLGVLLFGFLTCLLWNVWIDISYMSMPVSPEPQTGSIHRIVVNHGFVRYVTKTELEKANFVHGPVFWLMIAFFAGLVLLKAYTEDV